MIVLVIILSIVCVYLVRENIQQRRYKEKLRNSLNVLSKALDSKNRLIESYAKSDKINLELINLYQTYFNAALEDLIKIYESTGHNEEDVKKLTDILLREKSLKENHTEILLEKATNRCK